jgi:hypothetical protein
MKKNGREIDIEEVGKSLKKILMRMTEGLLM